MDGVGCRAYVWSATDRDDRPSSPEVCVRGRWSAGLRLRIEGRVPPVATGVHTRPSLCMIAYTVSPGNGTATNSVDVLANDDKRKS